MDVKRIVVTGAAKPGIGAAITRRILDEGHNVIGTYAPNDTVEADSLKAQYAAERLQLSSVDHASRDSLGNFVRTLEPPLHGLVNAEFMFEMEDPEDFDHDLWDRLLAVNLTAPNFLLHELKGLLHDGASIVIITSTEGFIGSFGASAYAASKAAIHNLVKTFANNLGSRKIRVNAVAAGWIGGVMDTDEVFNMSRRITPLSRLGSPEDVASVTYFLLSDQSSFVNGTVITSDGGYTGVDTIAKYEFEDSRKK